MYRSLRQDPTVASILRQLEGTLRQVAEAELQMVVTVASDHDEADQVFLGRHAGHR
jgi:predicted dinucleotide-binding enzyme